MLKKKFKIYKKNQLNQIKKNYDYITVYCYDDLKKNEINQIQQIIKKKKGKLFFAKKSLFSFFFPKFKISGALLIIFSEKPLFLLKKETKELEKLELIFFFSKGVFYSNLKWIKIITSHNVFLKNLLKKPYLQFFYLLNKIHNKKADIT